MMLFFSENMFLIAQVIGVVAFVLSTLKFQFKKPYTIGIVNCCSSTLWAVHTFMLGGFTCALINLLSTIRIYACLKVQPHQRKIVFYLSVIVGGVLTLFIADGFISILPYIAFCCVGYAYVILDRPLLMRSMFIIGELIWIVYGLYIFSIPFAAAALMGVVSSLIGLYRYEKDNLTELYARVFLRTYP